MLDRDPIFGHMAFRFTHSFAGKKSGFIFFKELDSIISRFYSNFISLRGISPKGNGVPRRSSNFDYFRRSKIMTVLTLIPLAEQIDVVNNELKMDSGRSMLYVAPVKIPRLTQDFHKITEHSIISRKNKRSVKYIQGALFFAKHGYLFTFR